MENAKQDLQMITVVDLGPPLQKIAFDEATTLSEEARAVAVVALANKPEFYAFLAEVIALEKQIRAYSAGKRGLIGYSELLCAIQTTMTHSQHTVERAEKRKERPLTSRIASTIGQTLFGKRGNRDFRHIAGYTKEEIEEVVENAKSLGGKEDEIRAALAGAAERRNARRDAA